MITVPHELQHLETTEDFFEHFGVEYDVAKVNRLRLHILQRFHDYLAQAPEEPSDDAARDVLMRDYLRRAYDDFLASDPLKERVFKVLREAEKSQQEEATGTVFVPLDAIGIIPPRE